MKVTGVRSLYTKMLRLSDELHNDACRLADDKNYELSNLIAQLSRECKRLAEKIGEAK